MRYRIGQNEDLVKYGDYIVATRECKHFHREFEVCSNQYLGEKYVIYRGRNPYTEIPMYKYDKHGKEIERASQNCAIAVELPYPHKNSYNGYIPDRLKDYFNVALEDLVNFEHMKPKQEVLMKMKQ